MRLRTLVSLLLAALLVVACSQTTVPPGASPEARIQVQRIDGGLATSAVPTIDTSGYHPYFEQYDLGGMKVSLAGEVADDFVVPGGSSWRITHIGVVGDINDSIGYTWNLYHDDGGKPGGLLRHDVALEFTRQDLSDGYSSFYLFVLSEPLTLTAGTYWLGRVLGMYSGSLEVFSAWWQVAHPDGASSPVMYLRDGDSTWRATSGGYDGLAFGFYGAVVTAQDVIDAFDGWVADGEVVGNGSGKSAASRVGALRNMLVNAQQLIDAGDFAGACLQLADAQARIHLSGPIRPSHFVTGGGAISLYELIEDLRSTLGCG